MSAPVVNRSSPNGRASSCGASCAIVWASTSPETGVALKPPVPQPQSRYSPSTSRRPDDRRGVRRDVDDPGPRPQHVRARQGREERDEGGQLALDDVERPALGETVVGVDPGTDDELALERLADVDVDGVRHHDRRLDRLEQLRDEGLERVALERQPDAGHRREDRGVARRDDRHPARGDGAARRPDAGHAPAGDVDAGHLGALDEVDAERIGRPRIAPRDVVVLGDAAARLVGRPEDRVARLGRDVEDRADARHVLDRQPFGVDAAQAVGVDPSHALADVGQVVGEVHPAALVEQEVVVELLAERLPHLERLLVDRRALVEQVVGPDDRRIAGDVPAGQPAALDHRDVRDAVLAREVVGGREAVTPAADDHDVVGRARLRVPPQAGGVLRDALPVGGHGHRVPAACRRSVAGSVCRIGIV